MAFKIKKAYILGLANWLQDLKLSGAQSRYRTRFVNEAQATLNQIEKERIEILEKLAERNEDGSVKKESGDNGEQYVLPEGGMSQLAKEYGEIMSEEWIVDITEANKPQFDALKGIVLDTDYLFGPRDGDSDQTKSLRIRQMNDYPIWCESFEAI